MNNWNNYECDGQLSIFDIGKMPLKIRKPIRLIECFAGIGSQAMAMRDIGADFETYKVVEFDKFAIASYNAIHGTNFPTIDITQFKGEDLEIVDKDKYFYICFYSFPCTDLSNAGKMLGMAEGSGTRSSLLWEVKRLLEETPELPQCLIMENVPQIHSKANMPHFQRWLDYLESRGYSNYWQDLNAKNYGVAQSRNRTFCVSIKGPFTYEFPKPIPLTSCMKDYLEDEVDEKYYITSDKARDLIDKLIKDGKILTEQSRAEQSRAEQELIFAQSQELWITQAASRQDMTQELLTTSVTTPVLLSGQGSTLVGKTGVATCLMARDYKGLGNQQCNGVIECKKLSKGLKM